MLLKKRKLLFAPRNSLLLGSSEIIESAFSKLKMLDRECGNSGFTQSILGLSACFGETNYETVAKAFKITTFKDVELWNKKYVVAYFVTFL